MTKVSKFYGICLVLLLPMLMAFKSSFNNQNKLLPPETPFFTAFNLVDAQAEQLIPPNKMYTRNEAVELRNSLIQQVQANPKSLALNWSLVRFYACAPNFVGGNKGMALRYASNIYALNNYIGCLAYEYVYNRFGDEPNAENWYKRSLINRVPAGMEWKTVSYNKNAPFGVAVKGSFSNGKLQPLYEDYHGTYKRKFLTQACGNTCDYKIVTQFLKPEKGEFIVTSF
jgi:hypothetical protein